MKPSKRTDASTTTAVARAIRAAMAQEHGRAARIIDALDDYHGAALVAVGVAAVAFGDLPGADRMLDALAEGRQLSRVPSQPNARAWLRERLADHKPHLVSLIRAEAIADGFTTQTVRNAAYDLGVISNPETPGRVAARTWQLPAPRKLRVKARV